MGRLGNRDPAAVIGIARACAASDDLELAGVWTHFATADEPDSGYFDEQLERFGVVAETVRTEFPEVTIHAANSAAVLRDPRSHFDMVRCGVAIYGLDPFQGDPAERGLAPALSLSSYVADVKRVRRRRQRRLRADVEGAGRHQRRRAAARVRRRCPPRPLQQRRGAGPGPAPPAGRHVSMDNVTIDLGPETEVEPGDEAVLIGAQGEEAILAEEVARRLGHDQLRDHLRDLRPGPEGAGVSGLADRLGAARAGRDRATGAAGPRAAWIAGGAVRDAALGREVTDLDLAVAGDPAAAAKAIAEEGDGHAFELSAEFATWRVVARDGAWQVDATALRGETIEADLDARDFTLGAVAVPLAGGDPIDPHGGLADLERRLLRVVGEGSFAADPLRLLRAARLAAELGLEVDPATRRWPGPKPGARPSRPASASWPSCAS